MALLYILDLFTIEMKLGFNIRELKKMVMFGMIVSQLNMSFIIRVVGSLQQELLLTIQIMSMFLSSLYMMVVNQFVRAITQMKSCMKSTRENLNSRWIPCFMIIHPK